MDLLYVRMPFLSESLASERSLWSALGAANLREDSEPELSPRLPS